MWQTWQGSPKHDPTFFKQRLWGVLRGLSFAAVLQAYFHEASIDYRMRDIDTCGILSSHVTIQRREKDASRAKLRSYHDRWFANRRSGSVRCITCHVHVFFLDFIFHLGTIIMTIETRLQTYARCRVEFRVALATVAGRRSTRRTCLEIGVTGMTSRLVT